MNILHVINSSGLGGAETIVKEILARNKEHKCFCLFRDEKKNRFDDLDSRVYYGLDRKGFYKANIFLFLKLLRIVKKEEITIIHVHLAISLLYGIFVKIFKPSIILIYHEHGEVLFNSKFAFFLKIFGGFINTFIAVSETTKNVLISKSCVNKTKIVVIYNSINTEKIGRPHDKKAEKKCFTIGFAGRLTKIKGPDVFLKSLPLIKIDYEVVIAGDGEMRLMSEDYVAKNNLNDKVTFLGYVNKTSDFYNGIDLFICSSLSESFGIVIAEAQASGVPVVASDLPAIREVIVNEQTGMLFEVGNFVDLADKINLICRDERLYQTIKNEALKNSEKYSLEVFFKALNDVYENFSKNK